MSSSVLTTITLSLPSRLRPAVSFLFSNLAVAALLTLAFNQSFMRSILPLGGWPVAWPLISLLFLLNLFICQLFGIGRLQKAWLIILITISAVSQYFMLQYGVIIDKGMLINAIETDSHEVYALLSAEMLPYFICYLLLPAVLVFRAQHHGASARSQAKQYLFSMVSIIALILLLVMTQYQNLAGVMREHRSLKHQATPFNALNAVSGVVRSEILHPVIPAFKHYAQDARLVPATAKPQLLIMVLGETVRADHLGVNGYHRNTTPRLAKRNLINIGAIDACGTATAISVPCMFSYLEHDNYDEITAKHSDNLLDVLQRAGVKVLWRDNNSGCKDMCNRVEQDQSFALDCVAGECQDSALLNGLRQKILTTAQSAAPMLVVLHQQGNHGPEYYKRSLKQQKQFLPECENNLLVQCQTEQIINAYDNALLATDELLDNTIALLQSLSDTYDTSMLYVSDHGESLGENGVYLHGLPYWMAPEAQTKVPMLMWLSAQTVRRNMIDTRCVQHNAEQAGSHDMLFSSLLGWLEVKSAAILPSQNIFEQCSGQTIAKSS
ncbi:phosphoethanolamine transferase [Rheinheimera aquimaris]|uniref:phosphoethanolamine transferase n=1 Tax=Rheinheimera aquimaris TaxID=412437 RepID=UPI003A9879D3